MIKNRRNKFFCVIGIGDHSYFKIIPALLQSGKIIVGIVSRSSNFKIRKFRRFHKIELALKILPKETTFLINTPPSTHYYYISILLSLKRDFLVEKPIFTHPIQVIACKKYFLRDRKLIFREAFMYKYSLMYRKVRNFIKKNFHQIKSIRCNFLVPNYPQNTFRDNNNIESSPLYDIGCYIIDFFVSLNKSLKDFNIDNINYSKNKIVNINFSFSISNKSVHCEIGISKDYTNSIVINTLGGYNTEYSPIFYGRPKMKVIKNDIDKTNFTFYDNNAFVKMFKENKKIIKKYKRTNYYSILRVNQILFYLNSKIKNKHYEF